MTTPHTDVAIYSSVLEKPSSSVEPIQGQNSCIADKPSQSRGSWILLMGFIVVDGMYGGKKVHVRVCVRGFGR